MDETPLVDQPFSELNVCAPMKRMESGRVQREHIDVDENPRTRSVVVTLNLIVELAGYLIDIVIE